MTKKRNPKVRKRTKQHLICVSMAPHEFDYIKKWIGRGNRSNICCSALMQRAKEMETSLAPPG
jgi:hypothetical protein